MSSSPGQHRARIHQYVNGHEEKRHKGVAQGHHLVERAMRISRRAHDQPGSECVERQR
jgi:hypothetical protein